MLFINLAIVYIRIVKQLKSNTITIYLISLAVFIKGRKLKEAKIIKTLCLTVQACFMLT